MFKRIGKLSANHPKSVVAVWIVVLILSLIFGPKLNKNLTMGGFSDENSESALTDDFIKKNFNDVYSQRVILIIQNNQLEVSEQRYSDTIKLIEGELRRNSLVGRTMSAYSSNNKQLVVPKEHQAFIYIDLNTTDYEVIKYIDSLKTQLEDISPQIKDFSVKISGGPGVYYDIYASNKKDISTVEKIALPVVFILLLLVFRSLVASLLPILVGVTSILVSMALIYFCSLGMQLNALLTNVVTMLGLGVSIDYALFITQRFREEMQKGNDKKHAIIESVSTSGRSVFFAGLTVAVSLVSLLVPDTLLFRSVSIGGFIVVLVSLAIALTLLPAVLVLLGKRVDLIHLPYSKKVVKEGGFWHSLGLKLIKRPVVFMLLGIFLIGLLCPPVFNINMHIPVAAYGELPADSEARQGMEALTKEFGVGSVFPIRVMLKKENGTIYDSIGLAQLDSIIQKIKGIKNVDKVLSIMSLNDKIKDVEEGQKFFENRSKFPQELKERIKTFVSKDENSTILYIIPKTAPNVEETREIVRNLRNDTLKTLDTGFTASVTGETAIGLDFDKKVVDKLPLVIGILILLTFILLMIAFKSILIPIKAILLNGIVTAGTLGFLVFMYQNGHMPGRSPGAINVSTPVLLVAILFGLSVDYEVIIVSRMKEVYERTFNNSESIIEGFTSTVGMINGAASIMIAVFGSFIFASIRMVQELGVGLCIAVILDAVIVRTVLVPTSMKVMGHMNWWFFGRRRIKGSESAYNLK